MTQDLRRTGEANLWLKKNWVKRSTAGNKQNKNPHTSAFSQSESVPSTLQNKAQSATNPK